MLNPDVRVEDFTVEDWVRLLELFRSTAEVRGDERLRTGVVLLTRGGKLCKVLHSGHGRLEPSEEPWPAALSAVASRHHARWVARLELGALDELAERWAERLRPEHDLVAQVLELLHVVKELSLAGRLELWPFEPARWVIPSERLLKRPLDAVCPDGKTLVLGAFEHGELWTCVAVRRKGKGFDRVVGPERLRRDMGLVSYDWTRDYRHLVRAVELGIGSLSLGCFAEASTWRRLTNAPAPGAWAAAVAARDVVVYPVVPALAIPLGLDVGRAALAVVRDLTQRFDRSSWTRGVDRVRDRVSVDLDLERWLGFAPLAFLREALGLHENGSTAGQSARRAATANETGTDDREKEAD